EDGIRDFHVTGVQTCALPIWSLDTRIERTLITEARLAAELLARQRAVSPEALDAEADTLGTLGSARVTFIAPDGTVVGDSEVERSEESRVGNCERIQQSDLCL